MDEEIKARAHKLENFKALYATHILNLVGTVVLCTMSGAQYWSKGNTFDTILWLDLLSILLPGFLSLCGVSIWDDIGQPSEEAFDSVMTVLGFGIQFTAEIALYGLRLVAFITVVSRWHNLVFVTIGILILIASIASVIVSGKYLINLIKFNELSNGGTDSTVSSTSKMFSTFNKERHLTKGEPLDDLFRRDGHGVSKLDTTTEMVGRATNEATLADSNNVYRAKNFAKLTDDWMRDNQQRWTSYVDLPIDTSDEELEPLESISSRLPVMLADPQAEALALVTNIMIGDMVSYQTTNYLTNGSPDTEIGGYAKFSDLTKQLITLYANEQLLVNYNLINSFAYTYKGETTMLKLLPLVDVIKASGEGHEIEVMIKTFLDRDKVTAILSNDETALTTVKLMNDKLEVVLSEYSKQNASYVRSQWLKKLADQRAVSESILDDLQS